MDNIYCYYYYYINIYIYILPAAVGNKVGTLVGTTYIIIRIVEIIYIN